MSNPKFSGNRSYFSRNGYASRTSIILPFLKLLFLGLGYIPFVDAIPLRIRSFAHLLKEDALSAPGDPTLWIYLGTAVLLVLLGGALAGLTIALMGQDEIYLQVIATSGEGSERNNAAKVLRLLKKGKHWVLVTLLLGNVITNETLPIVLDRSIGGGWPAVAASTALVVIFGEVAPQSICVRYGLPIGAVTAPFTILLMWLLFPISWPIAKLLDWLLGEDHGTTYKKAGLKQLVTLHQTLGTTPNERLNADEVTIISAVLDLKDKPVGSIMTPMEDVFTLSSDAVLSEDLMHEIMREGYSRIPIHEPTKRGDFVGMLLVKILITYDPEDCKRVSEFSLATLPETRPETSCLDIINFFQEGKSHMVLVSDYPGETYGAMGVVTLEDVIEELIGEEIIDESDVFIDVHKAIRRMAPAPTHHARVPKGEIVTEQQETKAENRNEQVPLLVEYDDQDGNKTDGETSSTRRRALSQDPTTRTRTSLSELGRTSLSELSRSPKPTTFYMRTKGSANGVVDVTPVQMRGNTPEMKAHLRNLGPSNAASRPKQTRVNTIKIKSGVATIPELSVPKTAGETDNFVQDRPKPLRAQSIVSIPEPTSAQEGLGRDFITPGREAKDGVQAVQTCGYSLSSGSPSNHRSPSVEQMARGRSRGVQANLHQESQWGKAPAVPRSDSQSTLASMISWCSDESKSRAASPQRGAARSGSIMEQLVDSGGVKKLVLELTSSGEEAADGGASNPNTPRSSRPTSQRRAISGSKEEAAQQESNTSKKKRRKRGHKKTSYGGHEQMPLLRKDRRS